MQYPTQDTPTPEAIARKRTFLIHGPEADRPQPDQTDGLVTNDPKEFDPRMMGEAEPGPLVLPPSDAGVVAREKARTRSFKAKARRMWNWIKFICFMAILCAGAFLYWQYTERKHTYVVEPRICFFETADKQVRITGTRYYSYMQNEVFGLRWHRKEDTSIKTEIDLKGNSMVIASLGGKDGPTSKFVSMGEMGKEPLPPAETYIITMDKRSVVLSDETFCR